MNIYSDNDTLVIKDLSQLTAAEAPGFRKEITRAFESPHKNADLHCDLLEFLDSTGLGVLIALNKRATEAGGKLTLFHPRPNIIQLLELTRLQHLFHIVTTA